MFSYRRKKRQRSGWWLLIVVIAALVVFWRTGGFDLLASRLPPNPLIAQVTKTEAGAGSPIAPQTGPSPSKAGAQPPSPTNALAQGRPQVPLITVPPVPTPTPLPPSEVAKQYLAAWDEGRYSDMYSLLSKSAQSSISKQQFVERYQAISDEATIIKVDARLAASAANTVPSTDGSAVVLPFESRVNTSLVGELVEINSLPMTLANGQWRVEWTPSLVFKDLTGVNLIRMFPLEPRRGSILDRKGQPLATQAFMVVIGIVPGEIKDEPALLKTLSEMLNRPPAEIKKAYVNAQPQWFVPVGEARWQNEQGVKQKLAALPGVALRRRPIRWYPEGEHTAHVVGYVTRITAEQLKVLKPKGYTEDDFVGQTGVESWAEEILAGRRGGKLAVVTPKGEVVKIIAERDAVAGRDVELTLDLEIQKAAEEIIGQKPGSITVLDPRDNSILALVSYPRFDPNKFVTGFTQEEWDKLSNDESHPFLARPFNATYPTGSIFKVVTMAAGLESREFKPDTKFECKGSWGGVGQGQVWGDWKPGGHGVLDLRQGLVESCNIVFYEIGAQLDKKDAQSLPEMARNFGFGALTGVIGLVDATGVVPDAKWKRDQVSEDWYSGDSVNLAIGQGYFLATPLQVANAYSALAMNGNLRTPLLIKRTVQPDTGQAQPFIATTIRRLAVSDATLAVIREAMIKVASDPKGTANYAFSGFKVETAAKTGSAENQNPQSHAWFAGYAPARDPRYVVVVMVEGSGTGSESAAPLARRAFERLFASEQKAASQ